MAVPPPSPPLPITPPKTCPHVIDPDGLFFTIPLRILWYHHHPFLAGCWQTSPSSWPRPSLLCSSSFLLSLSSPFVVNVDKLPLHRLFLVAAFEIINKKPSRSKLTLYSTLPLLTQEFVLNLKSHNWKSCRVSNTLLPCLTFWLHWLYCKLCERTRVLLSSHPSTTVCLTANFAAYLKRGNIITYSKLNGRQRRRLPNFDNFLER